LKLSGATTITAAILASVDRGYFDGAVGRVYSFYIERPWLARPIGRLLWGGDVRPIYASFDTIGELPDGATVVDAPCGAGLAFTGISPDQDVRYVALDISPAMLDRARRKANALHLEQIELVQGDAERIPVEDGSADLFLSISGLHYMPDPAAAVREIARCLRPGGRVLGCMICRGDSRRQRLLVRPGLGGFGPGGASADLARWLDDARLETRRLDVSGVFAYFDACRPSA
jgi:SAM-dependent methyltransferase